MLAFALVFGLVFLAGKLASRRVGRRVRDSVVGPVDRVLGGGFGALKGLIGATLLYLAVNLVYDTIWGRAAERPEWMAESRTYPPAAIERRHDRRSGRGAARAGAAKRRTRTPQNGAMTEIRLHDTMAREKRVFTPADPKRVTMYVCGPTVYSRAHIGNARPAVVFDVLARLLRHVYGADSLVYAAQRHRRRRQDHRGGARRRASIPR